MEIQLPLRQRNVDYSIESGRSLDESLITKREQEPEGEACVDQPHITTEILLSRRRFVSIMVVFVSALVALLSVFARGVPIDKNVLDDLGSTKVVNSRIETYQILNGYATATVGKVIDKYFEVFTVVVGVFLANVRWYPRDDPGTGGTRFKRVCMLALAPLITYILNVGITASFVSHKTTGIVRIFQKDDLVANLTIDVQALTTTSMADGATQDTRSSILDTILRGAVLRQATPFEVRTDSPCSLTRENISSGSTPTNLPSVKELRSTAVVYGFPLMDWNINATPYSLVPDHTVTLQLSPTSGGELITELNNNFASFKNASNISWLVLYEILLQGKLLFERSISDSDATLEYPCIQVENPALYHKLQEGTSMADLSSRRRQRHLQGGDGEEGDDFSEDDWVNSGDWGDSGDWDGPEDGDGLDEEDHSQLDSSQDLDLGGAFDVQKRCSGAVSTLQDLSDMTNLSGHRVAGDGDVPDGLADFMDKMISGFTTTVPQLDPNTMKLTLSTFTVNPQIKLTAMTIDMPYVKTTKYRDTTGVCDQNGALTAETRERLRKRGVETSQDMEQITRLLCDQASYPYLTPRETCGHSSCIFLDQSGTIPFKKQLQLMPYLTNCSTGKLKYSSEYRNYFPTQCVKQNNSVFLFGLGSYMSGDTFEIGTDEIVPWIENPQRHVVLSFAKLEWTVQNLSTKFSASCGINTTVDSSQCNGLLYALGDVAQQGASVRKMNWQDNSVPMLVLGEDHLPAELMSRGFRDPVQLVSLNTRPFYYPEDIQLTSPDSFASSTSNYFEWEYIQKSRFNQSTAPVNDQTGNRTICSSLVDSYITHVERNRLYIDGPLQPLYTSAIFYLFQNAAVKTVKLHDMSVNTQSASAEVAAIGTTSLKGDLEKHIIKFSIPLASLVSTFVGILLLLVLTVLVIVWPAERLRKSDETNIAAVYAELLEHDEYSRKLFDRKLVLPTGEHVAIDEILSTLFDGGTRVASQNTTAVSQFLKHDRTDHQLEMQTPQLKLVYFDFGGRAEATRLALFIGDVAFEDKRVPYCDGFSSTSQGALYPYAMLPVLEVDGMAIAESMAMLRFAGRLSGLYPANDATGAMLIDEILELVEVFTERCLRWEREPDESHQRQLEHELTTLIIPQSFDAIDAKLAALKAHPTFSGESTPLFIHDLVLRSFVRFIIRPDWEEFVTDRSKITHWLQSIDKVENHPKVKMYYALQATADEMPLQLTDRGVGKATRGEPVRIALRIAGIAFENKRVDGAPGLALATKDGRVISSFFAILRFVGSLGGLYPAGQDAMLSFRIDELLGQLEELQNWWYYPAYTTGDTEKKRAFVGQLATETIPKFLTHLDHRVGSWASPYATGGTLTIADLAIYGTLSQLSSGTYLYDAPSVPTAPFPNLQKIYELVERHPKACVNQ